MPFTAEQVLGRPWAPGGGQGRSSRAEAGQEPALRSCCTVLLGAACTGRSRVSVLTWGHTCSTEVALESGVLAFLSSCVLSRMKKQAKQISLESSFLIQSQMALLCWLNQPSGSVDEENSMAGVQWLLLFHVCGVLLGPPKFEDPE